MDDAPATEVRAEGDGGVGRKDDGPVQAPPVGGQILLGQVSGGVECSGDDPHGLLGVVAAVSQAVGGGRDQLSTTEPVVDILRRSALEYPHDSHHEAKA